MNIQYRLMWVRYSKTHQLIKWFTRQFIMIDTDLIGNSILVDVDTMNKKTSTHQMVYITTYDDGYGFAWKFNIG